MADSEEGRITTIQSLADKVDKLWDMLTSGDKKPDTTEADQPASMAAEVRREVERLRQAEGAEQAAAQQAADVADLKEKVAASERQPREYRRSTKIMGWADERDR